MVTRWTEGERVLALFSRGRRRRRKAVSFVVDVGCDLAQRIFMLPCVVATEEQLTASGQTHSYIGLGTTTITSVGGE